MTSLALETVPNESASQASSLAHKLAAARRKLVEEFERYHGLSREEALARVREYDNAAFAEQLLRQPLRVTTWHDLDQIAAVNPELAVDRWDAIVDDALTEIESGHHAAAAVESGSDCWQRAQFLALREHLARDWQPRNGIELTLIDCMAQALVIRMFWLQRMLALDALESSNGIDSQLQLPRVSTFEAIKEAAAMADRFDRMFMRALRQLRDLRRYAPAVIVQNVGQVNVGQQQLNVAGGNEADREPSPGRRSA